MNQSTSNPKKKTGQTPCKETWKLWRHCCCRYGWYSILVMPIITSGCLLSLYSSLGCSFVDLDVGFTPSNSAYNKSTASLGLFTVYTGNKNDEENRFYNNILDGCEWYSDSFESSFIETDRTWKVARIMAYISAAASITATMTSWLFLLTPLPASFFWPGLLLPAVLVAFLAEGSKFLMFDTAVCRTSTWTPEGVNSLAQKAESCSLGSTAVYTIISGCIFFVSLMCVCLKAPKKRLLDETYGQPPFEDNNPNVLSQHGLHNSGIMFLDGNQRQQSGVDLESSHLDGGADHAFQESFPRQSDVYVIDETTHYPDYPINDFDSFSARSGKSMRSNRSNRSSLGGRRRSNRQRSLELTRVHSECSSEGQTLSSKGSRRRDSRSVSSRDGREMKALRRLPEDRRDDVAGETSSLSVTKSLYDDRVSAAEISFRRAERQRISESRMSKIVLLEQKAIAENTDLIDKFVEELDKSFQEEERADLHGVGALDMSSTLPTRSSNMIVEA